MLFSVQGVRRRQDAGATNLQGTRQMSTFPSIESMLLEIHHSFAGETSYQTKPKRGFATGNKQLKAHQQMGATILEEILKAFELDPQAQLDALRALSEFGNAYKALELSSWTFDADSRQILWVLMGRFIVPGIARRIGFWSLNGAIDAGMPGGRFWYLPESKPGHGEEPLDLPVIQVIDWLLDLVNKPLEALANDLSTSSESAADKLSEPLIRSIHHWRTGTAPELKTIQRYFPDSAVIHFNGTFEPNGQLSSDDKYNAALTFVARKGLNADKLRLEIPMTAPGRLEQVLEGTSSAEERDHFVTLLAERYAPPTPKRIRQRLRLARLTQDGYERLLKFLCPGVERTCPDPSRNKVLQLVTIYKLIFNLTVDAWRHEGHLGEAVENAWFEAHVPPLDAATLHLSILPSRRDDWCPALAREISHSFSSMSSKTELDDHIGLNAGATAPIIQRNLERQKQLVEELVAEIDLETRLKSGSPWRFLQSESRFSVVLQVAHSVGEASKVQSAVLNRLKELAQSPSESLQVALMELGALLNNNAGKKDKVCRARVEALLEECEHSPAYSLWKGPVQHYKAKHLLFCNDFEGATKHFKAARDSAAKRNYGPLRGEVARDAFATALADGRLIVNDHEVYFRAMLAGGVIESEEMPQIESVARQVSEYFWDELYSPYRDVEKRSPRTAKELKALLSGFMSHLRETNEEALLAWCQKNKKQLRSRLPDVDGNSAILALIKIRTHLAQAASQVAFAQSSALTPSQAEAHQMLARWRSAICLIAKQLCPEQVNMQDFKGQTPLMLATEEGCSEMVENLLAAGADPDLQDFTGKTALHSAVKAHSKSCVDMLLEHGCKTDLPTVDDRTALHTATWSGNLHALRRLIAINPEALSKEDIHGMTPLSLARNLASDALALSMLDKVLQKAGRSAPSRQQLEDIARELEVASPA